MSPSVDHAALDAALAALQQNNMADAIQFMQRAAEIAPNIALYKRNLGELLRRVGQWEAAITTHNMAISLEPESSENHFLLALVYNDIGQFALAVQHYHIALSFDKNNGLAWNNLGASYESMGDKHQAKSAYAAALHLNAKHTEAQNNLGAIYSEEGQIDKARIHFEAAIAANPNFIEAHYNLSLIKTYQLGDPHLAFLEAFEPNVNNYSVQARIHYYFSLGKALDDTQQYARAFKAYAEGNRLHYLQKPWNKTKLHDIVKHLPDVFTQHFLKQPAQTNETRCPIFIVGMPRAGTTLIEQILSSHKNIYGAGELSILDDVIQEACHAAQLPFNTWVAQLTDEELAALGKKYLDQTWRLAPDKQYIVDKMPANCFYIGMIRRMLPTAKIIHAIRDPMDSCFSCFTHLFKNNMLFAYDLTALGEYYILYAEAMQHWHTVLPSAAIFNLPYEDMVNHPEELSKQLIEYIGLPWDTNCLNFHKNNRAIKTASLVQVRKPIYKTSVQRWQHFANELQPLLQKVAPYRQKQVLATDPSHAYALHSLGIDAYQAGNITLAIQLIEQAIQHNAQVALFHSNLGEMHRQLKATQLSIQCGQHAAALDPHSATVLSNLGIAYYDAKQYEQAEQCHKLALAINPQLSCSLNNMGSIYKAYNKTKQAIEYYQAAIEASPHFVEPLNNLGVLFLHQQEYQQALNYLSQAITLAPAFSDAHCNLGLTYLGLNQCSDALMHFEKALQLKPNFAEAYFGIAKIHLHQHNFIESEIFIRKAITSNPQEVEFYKLIAEIYHVQGNHEQALMYLDQALSLDSTLTGLTLSKGGVLMEMGEISKAEEQLAKISTDPNIDTRILAHYSLVQLRKIKSDHPSLNDLLAIVNNHIQAVSPSKLEYLYFALGKCYDDLGQWQKAFEYFSQGCHLKRTRITFNMTEQIQLTNKLIDCFTPEVIEHLRAFANPSALPIFIVGMPRSGSTLVEQVLSSHPQVHGAGELKHFNHLIQWPIKNQQTTLSYPDNILHFTPDICRASTDKYLTYLQRYSPNAHRITDKMPHNYIAIGLIHALFPKAKIIHVQRNPIDTCLSCYTKLFTEGHLYSYDLTEIGQYYRSYERMMNHWRHILPSNTWLDITYESMVNNFDVEVKRLIEFCDLAWDPACLAFYQSKRQVRTASFSQVRQPVYTSSIQRWQRYERELAPLIHALNENLSAQQQA